MLGLSTIGTGIVRAGSLAWQVGRKYAPQIMTYSGIGGFIATIIYACKATTKAAGILEERDHQLEEIDICESDPDIEYTEDDAEEDRRIVEVQTRWKLIKCYGPVVTLGVASTALILGGHHIIQMRSASYAAAYKASEKAFRAYREAVAKKYGENPDRTVLDEQVPGIVEREKQRQKALTDGKDSKPKKRTTALTEVHDINQALWCRDTSSQWIESPRLNCSFLKDAQRKCNDFLRTHGYIFLNQVRKYLGLSYIPEGQYVGWILKRDKNDCETDGYVDFLHIDDPQKTPSQSVKDFFDLRNTEYVVLDFNHDGDIHNDVYLRDLIM